MMHLLSASLHEGLSVNRDVQNIWIHQTFIAQSITVIAKFVGTISQSRSR